MYAFVSNEYKGIVYTQRQLDFYASIYSYPKFVKVKTEEEALKFIRKSDRDFLKSGMRLNGKRDKVGYITIEYFIDNNTIFCNILTDKFGYIKLDNLPDNVKACQGYDYIKLKFTNVVLDDSLISHHCLAIQNILRVVGDIVNVELVVPDLSIYLALEKYTGKNLPIRKTRSMIAARLGQVYYTICKDIRK